MIVPSERCVALPDLAQANFGALRDGGDVLDPNGRAVRGLDDGVLDVLNAGVKAQRLHVDLLRALFNEAAAAVGVVVGDLLLDLADGEPVGDELFGIEPDLVFLGRTAEAGHVDDAGHALEVLLQRPVFERLLFHHVVGGICALQGVPEDLADGAPVGPHLRNESRRQVHLAQPLEHVLAIDVAGGVVIEDEHEAGEPRQGGRAQMGECGMPAI